MLFHAPHTIISCSPLYLYHTLGNFLISECPKGKVWLRVPHGLASRQMTLTHVQNGMNHSQTSHGLFSLTGVICLQ